MNNESSLNNMPLIVRTVLNSYELPWDGHHGVGHWARVLEKMRFISFGKFSWSK